MTNRPHYIKVFSKGSRTFFWSSVFFPAAVRHDVFVLYAFVRLADNFVDQLHQDRPGFEGYRSAWRAGIAGESVENPYVRDFIALAKRRQFDPSWVEAFFAAMERDFGSVHMRSAAELDHYVYGSAEVVGLMMARIMGLPSAAEPYAALLGKAFQLINFIRDIQEDIDLGRQYQPQALLDEFGLRSLQLNEVKQHPQAFEAFMQTRLQDYLHWQDQASIGFSHIPWRIRIPIQAATAMFAWTAKKIAEDPWQIYHRKVKPRPSQILFAILRAAVSRTESAPSHPISDQSPHEFHLPAAQSQRR